MTFLVEGLSRSVPAMEFAQEESHDEGHRLLAGHSHSFSVFRHWFDVEFHTTIIDTVDDFLVDEDK